MQKINKDILKYPHIILFILFIVGFTAFDMLKNDKYMSEFENRVLQQKPKVSVDTVFDGTYTEKYEKYINDQFVFRNAWIDIKARTESIIGKKENNGIIFGKDGYLFEVVDRIPDKSVARIEQNTGFLKKYADTFPQNEISVMLVPNSYEIYKDLVPKGIPMINQQDEIGKIYTELSKSKNIDTMNLYPTLSNHKGEYIYYKTDHHWTTLGAYYAYKQFVEGKGMEPVDINSLDYTSVEDFYGTYYSKAKLSTIKPDTINYFDVKVDHFEYETARTDSLYDLSKFETRDKYSAFMYGNNGLTYIKSPNAKNEIPKKLLVIKDSYANSIIPFLTYNYDEIYVVDLRGLPKKMSELMSQTKFDDVLVLYNFMNFMNDTNFLRMTQ